jgi:hypothetical protein
MTKVADPCPRCGERVVWIVNDVPGLYMQCDRCKAMGPIAPTSPMAREAWQRWRGMEMARQEKEGGNGQADPGHAG